MGSKDHEKKRNSMLFPTHSGDELQIKKVPNPKRALTSKEYSKNYRNKQFQKVAKLEAQAKSLEAEIVAKRPAIKCKEEYNLVLRTENDMMKQKLSQCSSQLMLKQAEYRQLKEEIERTKSSLANCIIESPELLDNLDSTTMQLLRFSLLDKSGPSTN